MRDRPTGDALLACARNVLRQEVLASVPSEHKHALLMAMNAMSIAERQLQYGEAPLQAEADSLASVLDAPVAVAALLEANRTLARRLRTGAGDPGQPSREALFAHLRAVARQRVLESSPKTLKA
ncbi:DUF6285 domain-containing protein (plasmid) [Thauera butanivorans]|uniref:DUF6285 domain-containing protein n=1 Tax=Thauera butanivorans TaxID=86174 RepID=UPI003AB805A7